MLKCKIMYDMSVIEHVKLTRKGAYSVITSGFDRRRRIAMIPVYSLTNKYENMGQQLRRETSFMKNSTLECKIMYDRRVREHVKHTRNDAYSVIMSEFGKRIRIGMMPAYI